MTKWPVRVRSALLGIGLLQLSCGDPKPLSDGIYSDFLDEFSEKFGEIRDCGSRVFLNTDVCEHELSMPYSWFLRCFFELPTEEGRIQETSCAPRTVTIAEASVEFGIAMSWYIAVPSESGECEFHYFQSLGTNSKYLVYEVCSGVEPLDACGAVERIGCNLVDVYEVLPYSALRSLRDLGDDGGDTGPVRLNSKRAVR